MNCPFCRIVKGELSAHIIYEDDQVLAFFDAAPMAPGHTLVIPRAHVERFTDLSPEQASQLCTAAVKVGKALKEVLGAAGLTVGVNDGRAAGQGIPHVHMHIIPRFPGDGGGSLHSILPYRRLRADPELAEKVRAHLNLPGN